MPLSLIVTEGVLPKSMEKATLVKLTEAMLRWHGITGNRFMTPNVVGSIQVLPVERTFSGMEETPVAFVEWKVPSFVFVDRKVQLGYIAEATNIVHEASGGRQPKEHIWVNVTHAIDGAWGIAGKAMTNDELGQNAAKG